MSGLRLLVVLTSGSIGLGALVVGAARSSERAFRPETQVVEVALGSAAVGFGNRDAGVTLLELGAFTCGSCRTFHRVFLPKLEKRFIRAGRLQFRFLNVGASQLDRRLDELLGCVVQRQGAREGLERVFEVAWTLAERMSTPERSVELEGCPIGRERHEPTVGEEVGRNIGVWTTPTFVIGRATDKDTVVGWVVTGVHSIQFFERYIEAAEAQLGL